MRDSTAAYRPAVSTDTAAPASAATREGRDGPGRVVDDLEQAVAQHEVRRAGRDDVAERVRIPLHRANPVVHPGVARPALQRGQGVRAGVDDRHHAPESRERHRPRAAAAADVQHPRRDPGPGGAEPGDLGCEDTPGGAAHRATPRTLSFAALGRRRGYAL